MNDEEILSIQPLSVKIPHLITPNRVPLIGDIVYYMGDEQYFTGAGLPGIITIPAMIIKISTAYCNLLLFPTWVTSRSDSASLIPVSSVMYSTEKIANTWHFREDK